MIDDSWRDSYDEWKLACPYDDYDDEPEDHCDHDEYEVDWEGRAECHYCGAHWWLTAEQLDAYQEAEARWMAEYDRQCRRGQSRFWRTVDWLGAIPQRIYHRLRRKPLPDIDNDLPF